MPRSSRHRLRNLLRDYEAPIYVRNVTDNLIELDISYSSDFKVTYIGSNRHRNTDWRVVRIWPGEVVNLREILHDEFFHSNMILPWLIDRGRLKVENDLSRWDEEHHWEELEAEKNRPMQRRSARYYAVQATRRKRRAAA